MENQKISDVTPLSGLTQLTSLSLAGNNIKDVSPLGKLVNLKQLYLLSRFDEYYSFYDNNLLEGDLGFENLVNLEFISLPYYYMVDVTSLKNLPKLKAINLFLYTPYNEMYIEDWDLTIRRPVETFKELSPKFFNGFEELDNVEELYIDGTYGFEDLITKMSLEQIGDMASLKKLTYISSAGTNIDNVAALTNVEDLQLKISYTVDYSPLKNLTKLKKLNLNNYNPKLDYIVQMKNLEELTLGGGTSKKVTSDITPLLGFTELKKLSVVVDPAADLSGLTKLKKLEVLDLGKRTKFKNISFLKGMTSLRELTLPIEGTVDITTVNSLPNLKVLRLYSGGRINFAPLGNNKAIEHIDIVYPTYIDDITSFSKMSNLKIFKAYLQVKSNIAPLKNMTKLEGFTFGYRYEFEDFSLLDSLKNLKAFNAQLDVHKLREKYPDFREGYREELSDWCYIIKND